MGNKKQILRFSHIATLFLIALALACAVWIYFSLTNYTGDSFDQTVSEVSINDDLYQKIKSDVSYGTAVSPDEPGFGRVNPFSNYKAETVEVDAEATTETTEASTPTE